MLKTLEEPPEHVKFVLATTDPQKIPVDRAVALPAVQPEAAAAVRRSANGSRTSSTAEAIRVRRGGAAADSRAAAQGSLRDALSLLDQAIAFGGGEVREPAVRAMLGAVDRELPLPDRRCAARARRRGAARRGRRAGGAGQAFGAALDELASLFHRIAVAQAVPGAPVGDDARSHRRIRGRASRRKRCSSPIRSARRVAPTWRSPPTRRPAFR